MLLKKNVPGRLVYAALLVASTQAVFAQQVDKVKQLDTVVVTAGGFEQMIKDAPASITVITREELEKKPFNNLGDAVADVEGVSVERGGKTGGLNISIRGMGSDYTLILVDGKRVNRNSSGARPNGFGDVDTGFIPPLSAIERIEVVRGPMSTLYGSDAMGGVINIITRKVAKEWGGSITADGTVQLNDTFGNNYGSSFYLSGPIKEDLLGVSIYGRYDRDLAAHEEFAGSYDSTTKTFGTSNVSGNGYTGTKMHNVGVKFALSPNQNHDVIFDVEQGIQRYDNSTGQLGTLNSSASPGRNQTSGGYEGEQRYDRTRYGLTHLGRYGSLNSDSSIVYETTETKGRTNPISNPKRSTDGTPRKINYDNLVLDSKWNWSLLDDTHNLTFGGQWREQKFQDGLVAGRVDTQQWQWALFLEDEWRIVENFALTVGARYDRNQQFGGNFSPRAYGVWNLSPNWTLKGGVARGYKAPDVQTVTEGVVGVRRQGADPIIGNTSLTPEKSTSTELGVYFDDLQGSKANITFFNTRFEDKLEAPATANCGAAPKTGVNCIYVGPDWASSRNIYKWQNINKATLRGFELGGSLPIVDGLTLGANYTLTDSSQDSGDNIGQPLSSEARHRLNMRLDWKIDGRASAWLKAEYRAKQYQGLNNQKQHEFYNPYWLFGVGGSYQVNKNVSLNASVENLLNKKFINYGFDSTGTWGNSYYRIMEGRRLWLSATVNF